MRFLTDTNKAGQRFDEGIEYLEEARGKALAMWTYASEELLELEYREVFLKTWQFAGHVSELAEPGAYIVFDLWRDSVIIMRGKDGVLRAFQNVCRHRASRLVDGKGQCKGVIQCQYHGWTFNLDGSLKSITESKNFPACDKSQLGLNPVELEVYRGLIFVKLEPSDCLSVQEQYAPIDKFIAAYRPEELIRLEGAFGQVWECNWKLAWDNYAENYHIPMGHPGLQRMTREGGEGGELSTGIGFGTFKMKEKPSKNPDEARYQSLIHAADHRVDDAVKRCWLQVSMHMNMGLEFGNEVFWNFQILPLGVDKTEIRYTGYTRKHLSEEEQELLALNIKLNGTVNNEDKVLVERIQRGAKTTGYVPGPLSYIESTLALNHIRFRALFPVAGRDSAPPWGALAAENERLKAEQ
jgi:phenylpropionate dioxygenase-like ring-hydroxylating dioxygenase large terminal subunit